VQGAGKPLGFGAITVGVDWQATELRTGEALRGSWLSLRRPAPCTREQIEALAEVFERQAKTRRVLASGLAAFQAVARGLPAPAGYPRTRQEPESQNYRWFASNERVKHGQIKYGFSLPHVLEENQDLPFLPPGDD
jgi:hypothetical protein